MAFLNNLKGAPMPPIKNVLKDAWQSAKQSMPDRQRQQQYEDPTSEYGGSSQVSHGSSQQQPQRPHNVHFADGIDEPGQQRPTELNPLNPFRSSTNPFGTANEETGNGYQYEDTGFNQSGYQDGGFPAR
jgi:solute carrier family 32 (vesicular inhibitory amino acid transporter)